MSVTDNGDKGGKKTNQRNKKTEKNYFKISLKGGAILWPNLHQVGHTLLFKNVYIGFYLCYYLSLNYVLIIMYL